MMFFYLLLSSALAYTDLEYETSFKTYLKEYNKVYEGDEVAYRFDIYKANMDKVLEHNSGNSSWTIGINQFSDLTQAEFEKMMLGYIPRGADTREKVSRSRSPETSIDWREKSGALTPVKDQGQCGSCWAFSTTGGIEGALYRKQGHATSLSEASLVDCSGSYGNQGCNGGLMDNAFKFVEHKGIPTESSYPYVPHTETCHSFTSFTKVSTYKDVSDLESAIQVQPVSVAVDARKWSSYSGGTFSCTGSTQLDHGVLLVGSYSNYWVIKNSWGTMWGMEGFIQLAKGSGANCGVDEAASYPTI